MSRATDAADVRAVALPLGGDRRDLDLLLERVGNADVVLLGEATHGTQEFYRERALLTQRLIEDEGFAGVAVEADWPDAFRVDRYVRGRGTDRDAESALSGFERFPTWMWRNTEVLAFVRWLREYNDRLPPGTPRAGFYGLDLYSLHGSIAAVLEYLERTDPAAATRARFRYSCFDHYGEDSQTYGYIAGLDLGLSCEDSVVAQLVELRRLAASSAGDDPDERFAAEQNARLVRNAEMYYRTMFRGPAASWNLRDTHMYETYEALRTHLVTRDGRPAKLVLWAHNSHLGDARATQMGAQGELSLGQLVRERADLKSCLVGFSTSTGMVTAADDWNAPPRQRRVRPPLAGSYEALFGMVGLPRFLLDLRSPEGAAQLLAGPRLQRAIGVIYRPETERQSHYFETRLTQQFDLLLHFEQTQALQPLQPLSGWHAAEGDDLPETFPTAL